MNVKILRTKGWGPFRKEWYSTCSAHQQYDDTCERCRAGQYLYVLAIHIDQFLFDYHIDFWHKMNDRESKRRRIL